MLKLIYSSIRERFRLWLLITLCGLVFYYIFLMLSLIVRFGHFPNYVTFYDWFGNVATILASTPSFMDTLPIIAEEWIVEIGYMNYSFGNGISEWSLNLIPAKMFVVLLLSAFIALNVVLLLKQRNYCSANTMRSAGVATGLGGILVAMTNATMTWVVCCATPTWIVGLAMLGLGVSTSFLLEPFGTWLAFAGFFFLGLTTYFLARSILKADTQNIKSDPQIAAAKA